MLGDGIEGARRDHGLEIGQRQPGSAKQSRQPARHVVSCGACPWRAPSTVSRHHSSRIAPSIGSRTRFGDPRHFVIEGIEREQIGPRCGRREQAEK